MKMPVFEELKLLIITSGLSVDRLAEVSGVANKTIYTWLNGRTQFPRIDTMMRVALALGRFIELTPTVKKMVEFYPPPKERMMSRHALRMAMLRLQ